MDYKGACHDGSGTVLPQDNLRSYILSALQRIYRDLETVSSSIDRNITEHVLYRLEHVIVLILQCQSTWPNFNQKSCRAPQPTKSIATTKSAGYFYPRFYRPNQFKLPPNQFKST